MHAVDLFMLCGIVLPIGHKSIDLVTRLLSLQLNYLGNQASYLVNHGINKHVDYGKLVEHTIPSRNLGRRNQYMLHMKKPAFAAGGVSLPLLSDSCPAGCLSLSYINHVLRFVQYRRWDVSRQTHPARPMPVVMQSWRRSTHPRPQSPVTGHPGTTVWRWTYAYLESRTSGCRLGHRRVQQRRSEVIAKDGVT